MIMIESVMAIVGGLLFIVSMIDLKSKAVPSAMLTGIIILPLAINIHLGLVNNVLMGLLTLGMAILLFDLDFIGGIGDVKVMAVLGLFANSVYQVFFLVIIVMVVGVLWKAGFLLYYKRKSKEYIPEEIPFIPVFFIAFLIMIITGSLF